MAPELDKAAFKKGCEEGHGSYVENADGSFQCNMRLGGTVKCQDTKSQCTYTAQISTSTSVVVKLTRPGTMVLLSLPSGKPARSGIRPSGSKPRR